MALISFSSLGLSDIKSDEELLYYPTFGYITPSGVTILEIHGHVYEPEEDSILRNRFLGVLRNTIGLKKDKAETELFKKRIRLFLVDNERNKSVSIKLGEKTFSLDKSASNGHFVSTLVLEKEWIQNMKVTDGFIKFQTILSKNDTRQFNGRVQVIEPEGISIISDVDDTIKISQVTDKKELMKNTFLRSYKPVPGMNELYQSWAGKGAAFHYVSGSPWQLFVPLLEFMHQHKFPFGSVHMKYFRIKDRSLFSFLQADQQSYKIGRILEIFERFPKRRFILVGDSGEKDPEVYAHLADTHHKQVAAICIRNMDNQSESPDRINDLIKSTGSIPWYLFKNGKELAKHLMIESL